MKRLAIILLIIFIQNLTVFASNPMLSEIETNIFGYEYKNDKDSKRIERIESYLYGEKKTGNINKRIENIKVDIGYISEQEKLANEQKLQLEKEKILQEKKKKEMLALKESASVEYPMVDKIEEELFKTTYKSENIYNRLDRLEKQVFNKTSNESLNERVDKLASVVVPQKNKKHRNDNYQYSANDMDSYYRNSGLSPVDNQSLPFQLAVLEQDLLRNNYDTDNISNRLSRLEHKLFNRTFSSDTDITRVQRIMVAYEAKQNSHKYENNRKMQNMATASQIGGILLMILAMIL